MAKIVTGGRFVHALHPFVFCGVVGLCKREWGATVQRVRWADRAESEICIVTKRARAFVLNGSRMLSSDKGLSSVARTLKAS